MVKDAQIGARSLLRNSATMKACHARQISTQRMTDTKAKGEPLMESFKPWKVTIPHVSNQINRNAWQKLFSATLDIDSYRLIQKLIVKDSSDVQAIFHSPSRDRKGCLIWQDHCPRDSTRWSFSGRKKRTVVRCWPSFWDERQLRLQIQNDWGIGNCQLNNSCTHSHKISYSLLRVFLCAQMIWLSWSECPKSFTTNNTWVLEHDSPSGDHLPPPQRRTYPPSNKTYQGQMA